MEEKLKIVVVGNVDAGKSTLIGRFLYDSGALYKDVVEEINQKLLDDFEFAYLLDSLEEERKNQLTIDTTQAFCKTKKGREFIFIDTPGHQELIKNMLCGSSYADIAILVVDMQRSIAEQTKRHVFILKFLGIREIIIVLNKMDSIGFNEAIFKEIKNEVAKFLKKLQLQPKYFIPTSAKQGDNLLKMSKKMAWYKGLPLVEALNAYFKKKNKRPFCFPIQDIYGINKEKVAVGKIISGEVKKGDKVNISPLNKECKVRAIKVFDKDRSFAGAPESIGLIFDDMNDLKRGQIICKSRLPRVSSNILAKILCIQPLNINENLVFKCLTQETLARISKISRIWDMVSLESRIGEGALRENDVAEVNIVTDNPVSSESFEGLNSLGRFVLENNKEICAAGIIL